jgi:PAS domain S-box-containing protein
MITQGAGAPDVMELLEHQRDVLDRIASGAPLQEVLDALVRLIQGHAPGMLCAILLTDQDGQHLRFVAAPDIPEDFKTGIAPFLRIAPGMGGTCGMAAFLRQPVYTRDTATDPLWRNTAHIAVRNGLRAIWSTPILSGEGVLGTFAMYYAEPRMPGPEHMRLIAMATQIARLAIECRRDDDVLRLMFQPRRVVITDLAGTMVRVSDGFATLLGYGSDELRGHDVTTVAPDEDHDALISRLLALGERRLLVHRHYRTRPGQPLVLRENWAMIRDGERRGRYVVGRVEHAIEAARHPLEQLSPREREVLRWVAAGQTSKEIGARLHITSATVDTYRSRLMTKLGTPHLAGLVRFAVENGVADPVA